MAQNRGLVLAARSLLCDVLGVEAPAPPEMIGSLATIPLPDGGPLAGGLDELHVRLFEHHRIEVPVVPWPRPGRRWLRVSAQLHNDLGDYQALAEALRQEGLGAPRDPA